MKREPSKTWTREYITPHGRCTSGWHRYWVGERSDGFVFFQGFRTDSTGEPTELGRITLAIGKVRYTGQIQKSTGRFEDACVDFDRAIFEQDEKEKTVAS